MLHAQSKLRNFIYFEDDMRDKEESAYLQLFASTLLMLVMFHPSHIAVTCYTLGKTSSPTELFTPDSHTSTHTQRYPGKKGSAIMREILSLLDSL